MDVDGNEPTLGPCAAQAASPSVPRAMVHPQPAVGFTAGNAENPLEWMDGLDGHQARTTATNPTSTTPCQPRPARPPGDRKRSRLPAATRRALKRQGACSYLRDVITTSRHAHCWRAGPVSALPQRTNTVPARGSSLRHRLRRGTVSPVALRTGDVTSGSHGEI